MDWRCQDEYLHCASPGLAGRRVNITYRWFRNHTSSCPLAAGVLGSLPTCAHGSPVLGSVLGEFFCSSVCIIGDSGGLDLRVALCAFKPSFLYIRSKRAHASIPSVLPFWSELRGLEYVFLLEVLGVQQLDSELWPSGELDEKGKLLALYASLVGIAQSLWL